MTTTDLTPKEAPVPLLDLSVIFPAPVSFDPPLKPCDPLPYGVTIPACPGCGDGTVFINVCGKCGSTDPGNLCCDEYPSLKGAYGSVLAGQHSWLGCAVVAPIAAA